MDPRHIGCVGFGISLNGIIYILLNIDYMMIWLMINESHSDKNIPFSESMHQLNERKMTRDFSEVQQSSGVPLAYLDWEFWFSIKKPTDWS